jgi:hypothetical protein
MTSETFQEFEGYSEDDLDLDDAIFIVSFFVDDDGEVSMSAAGDMDDRELRECYVDGLRSMADKIEGITNHERPH